MALKFNCPGCDSEIVVRYLKIGETAKCWSCGAEVVVPQNAAEGTFAETAPSPAVFPTTAEPMVTTEEETERIRSSFNWGAFFLAPLWLLFHGRVGTGILLIFLNFGFRVISALSVGGYVLAFLASLSLAFYFGTQGNRIAQEFRGYASLEEIRRKEKGWTIAGIVVGLVVIVPLTIIGFASPYYGR